MGHAAAGPVGAMTNPNSFHLALYLDPDDKTCECKDIKPMTIGGQRSNWNGQLVIAKNYPGDSPAPGGATPILTVPTSSGMTDCEFIRQIIAAGDRYQPFVYGFPYISPIPGRLDGGMPPGQYNSNSVVSGLIGAAGGTPPSIDSTAGVQFPGYSSPMPIPSR